MSEEETPTSPGEKEEVPIAIMDILQQSLKSADDDRKHLDEELEKIRTNSDELRKIIYKPYEGKKGEDLPGEFGEPERFLTVWDKTDRALGNTILMIMPPAIFESMDMPSSPQPQETPSPQPIIISTQNPEQTSGRQPSRGFLSGIWDYRITKAEIKASLQKAERPTITSDKITYNPKDIVYQLIPSLNRTKTLYFQYLERFTSSSEPSIFLIKLGHMRLREEMSKYFNVVNPFCYASIVFQTEKIRRDKLTQIASMSRIAEAQAMYPMGMMGPSAGGGPPAKQDSLAIQMRIQEAVERAVQREIRRQRK